MKKLLPALLLAFGLCLSGGCGQKGPLVPPEPASSISGQFR